MRRLLDAGAAVEVRNRMGGATRLSEALERSHMKTGARYTVQRAVRRVVQMLNYVVLIGAVVLAVLRPASMMSWLLLVVAVCNVIVFRSLLRSSPPPPPRNP